MEQNSPRRAGIYCRLSYALDGSLEKVERQEGDCRELGQRLRWPISNKHVFADNSRSAWQRNRKRPGWDALLRAVEAREIDAIIVYHGDRLIRQPWDLETLISIADQRGVRIASPSGTRDLDSPDDRFILRIEAAQACRESDNTSRRVRRHLAARRERGLTQAGGRRPFGYGVQTGTRIRTHPDTGEQIEVPVYDTTQQAPDEAAILAGAAERLLAGQSQGGVVRWMRGQCTTTEGGQWTPRGLRNLMLSPRIAALIEHEGELYEAAWTPIVSRETWEDLRALYQRNALESPHPGRERRHLLSGVAECYRCPGARVRARPTGGRNRPDSRVYHCSECRSWGRNQEHLDGYVTGLTLRLLQDRRLAAELHAAQEGEGAGAGVQIAELERRRRRAKEQLENLADYPEIDTMLVARSLGSFERRIAELRHSVTATAERRLLARMVGISREGWEAEPVDVRAAVIRALFRVVILPATRRGPGFDPGAVRVTRRSLSGSEDVQA